MKVPTKALPNWPLSLQVRSFKGKTMEADDRYDIKG